MACNIVTAGAAGAVYRMGIWLVDNTDNPFAVVVGQQYASLLSDFGTVDATTTGDKLITPAAAVVVPVGRWFVLGGVSQVAVAQPTIGLGGPVFNPMGQAGTATGVSGTGAWLSQGGVTGVLGNFVPTGLGMNIGHGVGFRRSA